MRAAKAFGCLFLVVLLAGLAAAGGAAWWAWSALHRPHGAGVEVVLIEPGTGAGTILARLEARGVLPDARLARAYLVYLLGDPPIQAGEYRFELPMAPVEVLDQLVRGDVVLHRVTVVEGLTLEETAQALAGAGFGELDALLEAMRDPGPIAELDPAAENLEGYLFPETYSFLRGTGEREIVATLVGTFRRRFAEHVVPLAAERPWTVRELVTLASIVEKEAKVEEERRLIAGVYANRLAAGMGLYADPTVIYALKLRGEWAGNLTREHLGMDSPYNTYRYAGLPPGPIASPGPASLQAAADPAEVPYLYFVSRNDGSHVFARTLAEHNANVRRWQKDYWRDRWAQERAERERGASPPPD